MEFTAAIATMALQLALIFIGFLSRQRESKQATRDISLA